MQVIAEGSDKAELEWQVVKAAVGELPDVAGDLRDDTTVEIERERDSVAVQAIDQPFPHISIHHAI